MISISVLGERIVRNGSEETLVTLLGRNTSHVYLHTLPYVVFQVRTPRRGEQAHSWNESHFWVFLPAFMWHCIFLPLYRHLHLKMMFWDASVTSSRKMQINVDFCYYQLHQSKQAEAGTLLEFDKLYIWMISPRGLGKIHLVPFPIIDEHQLLHAELPAYTTLRPPPSLFFFRLSTALLISEM